MLQSMELMSYLDELRINKKLTIENICKDVVSRRSYTRYISGETILTFETLVKFLHNMDVSLKEFSFYVYQTLIKLNPEEIEFVNALQLDDIPSAKKLYELKIKHKKLHTEIGNSVIPLGIPYMRYKLGELTKEQARMQMQKIINLDELVQTFMIQDGMIISLFLYVRLASDQDKLIIFKYLYKTIKNKEPRIFAERYDYAQMLLYVTAIQCLTTLSSLTKKQEKQMNNVLNNALTFHNKARIHTVDYFLFSILHDYIRRAGIKNTCVTYYYVTTMLYIPSDFIKNQKIKLTEEEYQSYLACINDDTFHTEHMYERLLKDGIYA